MRPHPQQGQIRPKISTMPRQKTEAAAYLDIYKLVNERTRLQHELEALEQRRDRIQQRLTTIEAQINQLELNAHALRDAPTSAIKPTTPSPSTESCDFNTLFLEY
ncbi:gas vesicle protein GvpV [Leptothermofonsia sichuanensis E412]|uniref:gas vesicle protein GvpV n=1 Tax=Leptothermofonsia sichuanensis TaxID=2917832 RepID=UPI001CA74993|nr:gas vesicle protein GvpV [Leptothermofonsia sichuanensis]QZZ19487.1 gas vesicle protein GvpV [Leptothermofonsia sichuanensis E412]